MENIDRQSRESLNSPLYEVPAHVWKDIEQRIAARQPFLNDATTAIEGLHDPRWEIRAAAAHTLGTNGNRQALATALLDDHPLVRMAAVRALARIGALDAIVEAYQDPDWRVREIVILSLAATDPSHSVIRTALHDSNLEVRLAAAAAETTAPVDLQASPWQRISAGSAHVWQVLAAQKRLVHPAIWLTTAGIMLATGIFAVIATLATHSFAHNAGILVAIATLLCAGVSIAFLVDEHHEPSREITLATRTPIGIILVCRGVLVGGYLALLSFIVSCTLAVVGSMGLAAVVGLWALPLAALAALALAMAAVAGSTVAAAGSVLLVALQSCRLSIVHGLSLALTAHFWPLSPVSVAVTLVALGVAVVGAQHPRLQEARS